MFLLLCIVLYLSPIIPIVLYYILVIPWLSIVTWIIECKAVNYSDLLKSKGIKYPYDI